MLKTVWACLYWSGKEKKKTHPVMGDGSSVDKFDGGIAMILLCKLQNFAVDERRAEGRWLTFWPL